MLGKVNKNSSQPDYNLKGLAKVQQQLHRLNSMNEKTEGGMIDAASAHISSQQVIAMSPEQAPIITVQS